MTAKDMKFRFIIPQWDEASASFIPCLEPDTRFASKTLCECEFLCGDAYSLGYVRAEEMLLDHEVLAEKFHVESYLQWACERFHSGKMLPEFLNDATPLVDEAERITALALYRMVSVEMNHQHYDGGSNPAHCQCTKIADYKLRFYFLLPSLEFEIEEDAYNYGYRKREPMDLTGERLNVPYTGFTHMVTRIAKEVAERDEQKRRANAIKIVIGNVEDIAADAVVNAANEHLAAGSGVCGAIFKKAGYSVLQAACDKVAPCPTGEARITPAFGISNAKYIIHAVGPRYIDGDHGEEKKLASCYRSIFEVAVANGCASIAIPSISTGVFAYPLDEAVQIAVKEAKAFVAGHKGVNVTFVIWGGDRDGGAGAKKLYEETMIYGMSAKQYALEMDETYDPDKIGG